MRQQTRHLSLLDDELLEQVDSGTEAEGVAEVLHDAGGEVVGDDGGDLDLWLRAELPSCRGEGISEGIDAAQDHPPTLEEGRLGCRDETLLCLECGDGVELAESSEALQ